MKSGIGFGIGIAICGVFSLSKPIVIANPPNATREVKPQISRKISPEEIAQAVRDLGSDSFADREVASRSLWNAGQAAEAALQQASHSSDAEVVWRAQAILKNFQLGVFPDTPPEVVQRVRYFLTEADVNTRWKSLQQMQARHEHQAVLRLIVRGDDPPTRDMFAVRVAPGVIGFVQKLLAEEQLTQAEELLRWGAYTGSDELIHSYVVFLHVSEMLSDSLLAWESDSAKAKPQRSAFDEPLREEVREKLLVAGLRMQNRLEEAMAVAQRRESFRPLQLNVAFECRDWPQVAALHRAVQPNVSRTSRSFVEWLGYAATFDRLAEDTKSFEERINELITTGKKKTSVDFYCAEALLINERVEEAIEVAKAAQVLYAFRLLCAQYRYREAFEIAGWKDISSPDRTWIEPLIKKAKSTKWRDLALDVVDELRKLGRKELAQQLFDALIATRSQTSASRLTTLAKDAMKAGMLDQADRFAAKALAFKLTQSVWATLYPKDAARAESWWAYFSQTAEENLAAISGRSEKEDAILKYVQRVRSVMTPSRAISLKSGMLDAWLTSAAEYEVEKTGRSTATGADWVYLVGRTASQHGKRELARQCYEKAAPKSALAAIALGDLQRTKGHTPQAVKSYRRAVEISPNNALARYLLSLTLEQTGDAAKADRQRKIAEILPLATRNRHELSDGLRLRQLDEHARRQWRIGLRAGSWKDYYVGISAKNLGVSARKTDPAQALDYYHEYWLAFLRANFRFTLMASHLRTSVRLDKYRALLWLEQNNVAEAARRIRKAAKTIPSNLPFVQEVVPVLDQYVAGERRSGEHRSGEHRSGEHRSGEHRSGEHDLAETANDIFDEALAVHEQLLTDFPESAWLHNNLAWASALCNRKLDRAKELAQRAVKLAPENPAYLHTLAEVHFRRGDHAKAVELVRRCIEKTPYTSRYLPDLKRYSGNER